MKVSVPWQEEMESAINLQSGAFWDVQLTAIKAAPKNEAIAT